MGRGSKEMTSQERLQGVLCMYDRIRELEGEAASLRAAGNRLADEVESRWSGPGGCGCPVCQAASAWRKATSE